MRLALLVAAATTAAASLVVATGGASVADKPSGACAGDHWQTATFPLEWEPGDPMDPHGTNLLWQIGLSGLVAEFGSLEAGLAAFGFATVEDLYAEVVHPGFVAIDRNTDGVLCVKPFPEQGHQADYLANGVDNTSHSRG